MDFGAYYARKEAEEEIMAAAKKAEALLGPDGLPDVNKVRAFALELGDMFAVAAEALCHDGELKKKEKRKKERTHRHTCF